MKDALDRISELQQRALDENNYNRRSIAPLKNRQNDH